jgi:hypothetical protein
MLRKYILARPNETPPYAAEIPIPSIGTVFVSSEEKDHPIDHVFDSNRGRAATRWIAGQPGEQAIIVAFDTPQTIHQVHLEIEEHEISRTQELQLSLSTDWGVTYRELLRQEYNFSPPSTTFEQEDWTIPGQQVTHLRLSIKPDKGGKDCRASVTSLALQ